MGRRYWVAAIAIWVCVAFTLAIGLVVSFGERPANQPANQQAEREQADEAKRYENKIKSPGFWRTYTKPRDTYAQWVMATFSVLATGISVWALMFVKKTLDASIRTDDATRRALELTADEHRLNRERFITDQRPWLTVFGKPSSDLVYSNGGLQVSVEFTIKNIGRTPAQSVWLNVALKIPELSEKQLDLSAIYEEVAHRKWPKTVGTTVFPGEEITTEHSFVWLPDELARVMRKKDDFIMPYVVGAVVYRSFLGDYDFHTGFMWSLVRSDEPRSVSTLKKRAPEAIFPDEGDIPALELSFNVPAFSVSTVA